MIRIMEATGEQRACTHLALMTEEWIGKLTRPYLMRLNLLYFKYEN